MRQPRFSSMTAYARAIPSLKMETWGTFNLVANKKHRSCVKSTNFSIVLVGRVMRVFTQTRFGSEKNHFDRACDDFEIEPEASIFCVDLIE